MPTLRQLRERGELPRKDPRRIKAHTKNVKGDRQHRYLITMRLRPYTASELRKILKLRGKDARRLRTHAYAELVRRKHTIVH